MSTSTVNPDSKAKVGGASVISATKDAHKYVLVPNPVESLSMTGVSVGLEDRLTLEQCDSIWNDIFRAAGVTQIPAQVGLRNGFLVWLAHNGSSPMSDFKTNITVEGINYSSRLLRVHVGERLRAFFRAQAELTYSLLVANDIIPLWGKKYGFVAPYEKFGFDVADALADIPAEAQLLLADAKKAAIPFDGKYKIATTYKSAGGQQAVPTTTTQSNDGRVTGFSYPPQV